jgi:hypothetical protein
MNTRQPLGYHTSLFKMCSHEEYDLVAMESITAVIYIPILILLLLEYTYFIKLGVNKSLTPYKQNCDFSS